MGLKITTNNEKQELDKKSIIVIIWLMTSIFVLFGGVAIYLGNHRLDAIIGTSFIFGLFSFGIILIILSHFVSYNNTIHLNRTFKLIIIFLVLLMFIIFFIILFIKINDFLDLYNIRKNIGSLTAFEGFFGFIGLFYEGLVIQSVLKKRLNTLSKVFLRGQYLIPMLIVFYWYIDNLVEFLISKPFYFSSVYIISVITSITLFIFMHTYAIANPINAKRNTQKRDENLLSNEDNLKAISDLQEKSFFGSETFLMNILRLLIFVECILFILTLSFVTIPSLFLLDVDLGTLYSLTTFILLLIKK